MASGRFRPAVGSAYRYHYRTAGPEEMEGVPVNFPLEGDWDFTAQEGDKELTVTVVEPSSAPGAGRFPAAELCFKDESAGDTVYRYYVQDEKARRLLGTYIQSEGGRESWDSYSPPLTVLAFPLAPGDTLEEEASYSNSEGYSYSITHRLTVLGMGAVRVPAGEFPLAVLIQDYEMSGNEAGYSTRISYRWYVPGVGQVASITSLPGETQAAFNRASSFRWLLSYEQAR